MTNRHKDIEDLFAQLANSLESSVLPQVRDHYTALQLRAAREMLLNLGARVEWRHENAASSEAMLRKALESLSTDGTAPAGDSGDLRTLRAELARVIEHVYDPVTDESTRERTLAEIWRVVRFEFDAEAARIKTGMFS
jgi:hypothetical protein